MCWWWKKDGKDINNPLLFGKDVFLRSEPQENRTKVWLIGTLLQVKIFPGTIYTCSCPGWVVGFSLAVSLHGFLQDCFKGWTWSFGIRNTSSPRCWNINYISRLQYWVLTTINLPAIENVSIFFLFWVCPGSLSRECRFLFWSGNIFWVVLKVFSDKLCAKWKSFPQLFSAALGANSVQVRYTVGRSFPFHRQ